MRGGAHGTVIGTYLHGPLLPKNAWFADWLIATALGHRAGALAPLDDALEDAAHRPPARRACAAWAASSVARDHASRTAARRLLLAVLVAACGGRRAAAGRRARRPAARSSATPATRKTTLTIGSKNFTEQQVLGEIYAAGPAGRRLQGQDRRSTSATEDIALAALKAGAIDAYPEYTGTALLVVLRQEGRRAAQGPAGRPTRRPSALRRRGPGRAPADAVHVLQRGRRDRRRRPTARPQDDLRPRRRGDRTSTLYGSPECRQRLDCLLGLEQVYGLQFKRFMPVDDRPAPRGARAPGAPTSRSSSPPTRRSSASSEVLLEDDKGMFPPYNSTLVMQQATADAAGPDLAKTLELDPARSSPTRTCRSSTRASTSTGRSRPPSRSEYLRQTRARSAPGAAPAPALAAEPRGVRDPAVVDVVGACRSASGSASAPCTRRPSRASRSGSRPSRATSRRSRCGSAGPARCRCRAPRRTTSPAPRKSFGYSRIPSIPSPSSSSR